MGASAIHSVLHLADYGGAYSGNFVASLRSLAEPCRALGLRVAIAFSDVAKDRPWLHELHADGFPVHLLSRGDSLAGRARAVAHLAAVENAALLHTHYSRYDVPAALTSGRARGRVVWHFHSPFATRRPVESRAKDAIKLRLFGRRARLAAVSEAIMRDAIGLGFPPGRACFIPNAVDLTHATAASAGREEVRRQLAIPEEAKVVLVFGWQPGRKGIDLALDALASLAGRDSAPILLAVGADDLQAFLRTCLGASPPAWLRFLRPQEQVGDLYAAADVFLSSSRAEGFPYAIGEALANGLPVVVSDIPGCEWARDVEGTRYFPPGDAPALAQALTDVLRWSAERRAQYAQSARAFARAHLSLGAWAARVCELYQVVLEEG